MLFINPKYFYIFSADTVFFATLSDYETPVVSGDPIVWDSAPLNPGGYFSTELGAYTAPVNGYYT